MATKSEKRLAEIEERLRWLEERVRDLSLTDAQKEEARYMQRILDRAPGELL